MGDPYWRYGAPAERGSIPRPSFPGYLLPEQSSLTSHHLWSSNDLQGISSDFVQKDPGAYGVNDITGIGIRPEPSLGGLTTGASIKGYPTSLQDPTLLGQRSDVSVGVGPGLSDLISERPGSLARVDGLPVPAKDSNILFVDGLPSDCLRREVGLFSNLMGIYDSLFYSITDSEKSNFNSQFNSQFDNYALESFHHPLVQEKGKKPSYLNPFTVLGNVDEGYTNAFSSGDKAMVLCFVEFNDAKCALTAMEALQGYKFDDKKPDSPVLRIHFAHFPFRLPSDRGEQWFGGPR
ncbi:hypothetical protein TEA_030138 [Camellia sinensis var. sinensis]|uniref:RRM domain-containing protein n=1 Tax=Camellia sinensis var. sinensis TaxID=542762 RepID=A0A4S4EN27_CAMSN|nr:hypothetical protein TEA_030138 [Camellia sinensis var. sinensis]